MKEDLKKLLDKYNIDSHKIIVFLIILLVVLLRVFMHNSLIAAPIDYLSSFYSKFLLSGTELLLSFSSTNFEFNYVNFEIINKAEILRVNSMMFSVNQMIAVLLIILLTPSKLKSKFIWILTSVLIIYLYNILRISIHAFSPDSFNTHNWLFNILLIPRWLIILGITYLYWLKYSSVKELIKQKFGFTELYINKVFLYLAVLNTIYFFVIIIAFNDYFIISGDNFISIVLKTSQWFLDILGYESWIDYKTIYNAKAALYMDDGCLGVDLMYLFMSFVVVLPGPVKHKSWYIVSGLLVIVLLNCLRVILIFINLSNNTEYSIPLDIHDLFTYPVLVLTLVLWMIWINRFVIRKK